jgi:outer membrane protein assembly factor BamE (lipoprotein component of BamABCDE complex)
MARRIHWHGAAARALLVAAPLGLTSACSVGTQVTRHGYIADDGALDQIQLGSSKEQVRLVMGTPSTTATMGNEVYFYLSETKKTQLFLEPEVIDRRVLTFYFDDDDRLTRIANYGIEDGKVIDLISRKTPSRGDELTALRQIFGNIGYISPF